MPDVKKRALLYERDEDRSKPWRVFVGSAKSGKKLTLYRAELTGGDTKIPQVGQSFYVFVLGEWVIGEGPASVQVTYRDSANKPYHTVTSR